MPNLTYILLGLTAGVVSGLFGIGGATLLIPGLIFLCGLTQHQAQGTTLAAMIPPIGLLAALRYYAEGYVNLRAAILIALGFLAGSFLGACISVTLSNRTLSLIFAVLLLAVGAHIIWENT